MQAWGVSSQFSYRDCAREPSKSGIIGLICAALGRPRDAKLDDLARLKMGTRVDEEGTLLKDYQIARDIYKADGGNKTAELSNRYYLSGAIFLTGLEGDADVLGLIQNALQHPKWELYLGRKAFPPSKPVWLLDGFQKDKDLLSSFSDYPLLAEIKRKRLRISIEDPNGNIIRRDVPISFEKRLFTSRTIKMLEIDSPGIILKEGENVSV
jgi:CRISPR system Cascade subunit CasD